MSMGLPHYHDMEWRVDIRTGSRSLLRQVDPTIIMRIHTKDEGKELKELNIKFVIFPVNSSNSAWCDTQSNRIVFFCFFAGVVDTHLLQTDPVNLVHLTKSLESALAELKSQHCRRIMRSIK